MSVPVVVVSLLTVGVTTVVDVNITGLSVLVCLMHILYVQACIACQAILQL